jgi:hypothetical protein
MHAYAGSAAEVCGALVKAAYCLHHLGLHAAAAAALELVGFHRAAAALRLRAAAAAAAAADDDGGQGGATTTAASAFAVDWTEVQRVARVVADS